MAQKSGFFTSSSGDRKYGSDWLAQYIAAIISNGVYTTELTVSGDNGDMTVTVGAGRAWINGYMYSNDSNMTMALSAADGALSRTDLIVLRLDMTNRQITLAVVQGDFGGGVPALTRTSDIYELCLAQISVAAGTTQITAQIITDTRANETVCGIVAGAVTQLSTGELLEQLKAGFEEWFDGIKGQLSEDAAGNLQNQINDCVKLVDKATDEEAIAGTDDTKWMTPTKTAKAIIPVINKGWEKLQEYLVAGAYTWTAPDLFNGADYYIGVCITGAGGSGGIGFASSINAYVAGAYGGSSGYAKCFTLKVTPGNEYPVVVGAGGIAVSRASAGGANGNSGGTSSFNGTTANGGGGGRGWNGSSYPSYNPNNGGQTPSYFSGNTGLDTIPFGGALESSYISTSNYLYNSAQDPMCCFNPFENIRILGAGANSEVIVTSSILSSTFYSRPAGLSDDGIGGGTESHGYTGIIIAGDATDNGCGGGAACGVQLTSITSGKGGDGAVKIYVRGATI